MGQAAWVEGCCEKAVAPARRQPFMMFVEESLIMMFPGWTALRWEFVPVLPGYGRFPVSPLKLVSRTTIVCVTTVVVSCPPPHPQGPRLQPPPHVMSPIEDPQ